MERVPAGTCFEALEMVFSVYEAGDRERFVHVLEAMQLLQDDYLGGLGSRGSGKVVFENLNIRVRSREEYGREEQWTDMPQATDGETQVSLVLKEPHRAQLVAWLTEKIPCQSYGA
jgi:CRISPR/Cas system CSM-associated protein Csm3 (group 7 of RAMP superfamily)